MEEISTVGIDLAKSVFQIHAIDGTGKVVVRRQLRRQQMLKFFGLPVSRRFRTAHHSHLCLPAPDDLLR